MSKQPEALECAEWIEGEASGGSNWNAMAQNCGRVIRRQHALIAEMREALKQLEAMAERYRPPGYPIPDAQKLARAVIYKADQEEA